MLHRRTNTGSTPDAPLASASTPPKANAAYKPLRRGSSNLYSTPQSGAKARYNLPTPSPGLSVNTGGPSYGGPSGAGFAPTGYGHGLGGTFDLTDSYAPTGGYKGDWADIARTGLDRLKRGFGDAARIDRSLSLVWGDRELRTLVIKSTLINLVSLLLLSVSPLAFSSAAALSPAAQHRTQSVGLWYNVLLSWPVFVTCFWVNSLWAPVISRRAHVVLHPSYRHQPSPSSPLPSTNSSSSFNTDIITKIVSAIQRVLMISDFTFVSHVLAWIPVVGRPLSLAYMCVIDAFYAFDPTFASKGWGLDRKVDYLQERVAYMIGFGLPATVISSFGPPLVNMAVFALIYPFFVIQALVARPPTPRNSLLPSTPSPQASLPPSPDGQGAYSAASNPFFAGSSARAGSPAEWDVTQVLGRGKYVPIFFFARYAILVLRWFEAAVLRDRGDRRRSLGLGKERPGKRLG